MMRVTGSGRIRGFGPVLPRRAPGAPAVFGVGLAALGRPGYITLGHGTDLGRDRSLAALRRRTELVLDAAHTEGVRVFDAARSYGRGEAFLGAWLAERGVPRDAVLVSSKWGYDYVADWRVDADPHEVKNLSVETFRRQIGETRALLGDRLGLYQIHSATVSSGVLEDGEVRAELQALRAAGVAVGLSATGVEQSATIDRAVELELFDAVQATWNLHERSAGDSLVRAHAAGLLVTVKEGLANGRLSDQIAQPVLGPLAARLGATIDAVALAAVRARPWVDIVLSGAVTVDQLHDNLAARSVVWDTSCEEAVRSMVEAPSDYWARRGDLPWN